MGKSLPKSLPDFQRIFPNEEACYTYLYAARFPNGFICPYCNWSGNAYRFQNRPDMLRCKHCRRDTRLDCWHYYGKKQGATPYLVLGCFPCYIADSRDVGTPISEDARDKSVRNSFQHAAQASYCNGAARTRCNWWRVAS